MDKLCILFKWLASYILKCNRNSSSSRIRNFSISLGIHIRFLYVLTHPPIGNHPSVVGASVFLL